MKKWNIFGRIISVFFVKDMSKTTGKMGLYFDDKGEIHVCESMSVEDKLKTEYHEIGHGFLFRLGWGQILDSQACELFCEHFSTFIYENQHQFAQAEVSRKQAQKSNRVKKETASRVGTSP